MNQRIFSILIFIVLAAVLLAQCQPPTPERRNATITGVADDGTPTAVLFDAVSVGSIDAMNAAIGHGANVNARNSFDWTPLMIAVFYDQEHAVRWLIKHGANVNAASNTGVISVLEAARVGDRMILDELIEAGGDIRAVDQAGRSALILACESLHGASILCDLLARGLDPDQPDADGRTPLMEAASGGKVELAAILLKWGANLEAKDRAGHTSLQLAQMAHDDVTVAFLSSR